MTEREIMQQALEALNRSDYLGWQLNIPIIKALRERLAQPYCDDCGNTDPECPLAQSEQNDLYQQMGMRREDMTDREIMQQALEALDSCRNGWDHIGGEEFRSVSFNDDLVEDAKAVLNERLAQPEQDVWQWEEVYKDNVLIERRMKRGPDCGWEPWHTPRREWVGLTDNDLQPICNEYRILFGGWVHDFARAIEAKLKEKNA